MIFSFPFIISTEPFLGQKLKTLYPLSEKYTTHSDILAASANNKYLAELMKLLLSKKLNWDILRITRFIENTTIYKNLEEVLTNNNISYSTRTEAPSFFLTLPNDYDAYLKQRSSKFRNYLKRMEKKLNQKGELSNTYFNGTQCNDSLFETILDVEKRSWKHAHGTAISAVERQTRFYEQFCRGAALSGHLHISYLSVDDTVIAYNMGYINGNTYYYLKTSYDKDYRNTSPATVLRARLIEHLINNNIQFFDFPGEPYEWETQWASELQWHKSFLLYNRTFTAKLFAVLHKLKQIAKRQSNDDRTIAFIDARDLTAPQN